MYTEPGIEATASARELLYVYVYEIISRAVYHISSTFRHYPLTGKLNWGQTVGQAQNGDGACPPALAPPLMMTMMRVQLQTAQRLMFLLNSE